MHSIHADTSGGSLNHNLIIEHIYQTRVDYPHHIRSSEATAEEIEAVSNPELQPPTDATDSSAAYIRVHIIPAHDQLFILIFKLPMFLQIPGCFSEDGPKNATESQDGQPVATPARATVPTPKVDTALQNEANNSSAGSGSTPIDNSVEPTEPTKLPDEPIPSAEGTNATPASDAEPSPHEPPAKTQPEVSRKARRNF